MNQDYTYTVLGNTGIPVHRLGLSGTYWPGKKTIYKALDEGLNFFFCFGLDKQMIAVLRDVLKKDRERYIVATGAYNLLLGYPNLQRTLEKRLRQLSTDYIDIFLLLGLTKAKHFPDKIREELYRLRETDKVRTVGISTHHRKFAGKLAAEGALDIIMMRYNAAHRGAEEEIFPYLDQHKPGIVSYTATRWRRLLRRPHNWPKNKPIPSAGMCYRFVLSSPHVHVCMTAPSNMKHFRENLAAANQGPLSVEELGFMRDFGDAVYQSTKWFM